jgi:oxygen-independent coproporphyrinogen-3 oxidase
MLMMGLRLEEGVSIARIEAESRQGFSEAVPAARLARLEAGGFVARRDTRLVATKKGRQRLDAVLAALIA